MMARKNKRKPGRATAIQMGPVTTTYTTLRISTSMLISGQPYQRPVKRAQVRSIIENYDPRLMDDVIVNVRDGRYYVIDGQHRIAALREMNGGADVIVTCKVYRGMTYQQEADLYHKLDDSKTKLNTKDNIRSMSESEAYPEIEDIKRALSESGISLNLAAGGGRSNDRISAVRETVSAYDALGYDGFSRMIRLIKAAWNGSQKSLTSYILSGMALFLRTYGDSLEDAVFVRQMTKFRPEDIIMQGRADTTTTNGQLKYAKAILAKYNYQRRDKLPYRLEG